MADEPEAKDEPEKLDPDLDPIPLGPWLRASAAVIGLALFVIASIAVLKGTDGTALLAFILIGGVFELIALGGQIPQRIGGKDYRLEMYRHRLSQARGEITAAAEVMTPEQLQAAVESAKVEQEPARSSMLGAYASFENDALRNLDEACTVVGAQRDLVAVDSTRWDAIVRLANNSVVYVELKFNMRPAVFDFFIRDRVLRTDDRVLLIVNHAVRAVTHQYDGLPEDVRARFAICPNNVAAIAQRLQDLASA